MRRDVARSGAERVKLYEDSRTVTAPTSILPPGCGRLADRALAAARGFRDATPAAIRISPSGLPRDPRQLRAQLVAGVDACGCSDGRPVAGMVLDLAGSHRPSPARDCLRCGVRQADALRLVALPGTLRAAVCNCHSALYASVPAVRLLISHWMPSRACGPHVITRRRLMEWIRRRIARDGAPTAAGP